MRRALTLLLLISVAGIHSIAQSIAVTNINKLEIEQQVYFPKFGNSSEVLLFSGQQYKGLYLYQIQSKTTTLISNATESGNNPQMQVDGSIIFNEVTYKKGRKTTVSKLYRNGSTSQYLKPISSDKSVSAVGKKLVVSRKGETKILTPFPDNYYIWVSISPDNSMILFTAAGKGTYIINFDGEILYNLGYINAPKWLNNNWVIGMNDIDDGHQVTASDIIAIHLNTANVFNLTKDKNLDKPMYPEPSPNGDVVVFKAADGGVYLMNLFVIN